jgi:hypothetical protein
MQGVVLAGFSDANPSRQGNCRAERRRAGQLKEFLVAPSK